MNPFRSLLGLRVVRGPDWNLGSLDGGEGGVGTIVSVEIGQNGRPLPEKSVLVYWDSGPAVVCRAGFGDCYDLRVYDSAPAGVVHSHFICDECDHSAFAGTRWHCSECHDYDLCSDCYMNDKHPKDHNFVRFDRPNNRTDGSFLEDRLNASKVRARGIFPGATVRRGQHLTLDNDLDSNFGQVVEFTSWKGKPRSAVMIQWSDGLETTHRVGYEGKVDLELVESADGPSYYKDHLPVVEYQSKDTQRIFNVGDQVRLNRAHEIVKKMTQENSGWASNGNDSIGKVGRIFKIDDDDNVHVAYGPAWIFHPDLLQKIPELRVEDDAKTDTNIFLEMLFDAFLDVQNEIMEEALDKDKEGAVIQEIDDKVIDALFTVEGIPKDEQSFEQDLPEMTEQKKKEELFLASCNGDLQRVRYILTLDKDLINEKCEINYAPLHFACKNGNADVVSYLIQNGADVEIKDEDGYTPLHHAAYGDMTSECVVLMLTANAFVNAVSANTKLTPLHLAVDAGNLLVVSALINLGQCDVNYQNISGNTPLHCALFAEDSSILAEILKVPSLDPGICNKNGLNALQLACEENNITATRALMNKFPKLIDERNQDGLAPLHLAVLAKHCQIAKLLINEGHCSVDLLNNKGATALALAVSLAHKDMVEILMECGANVNAVDNEGDTPLHIAVMKYSTSDNGPDLVIVGGSDQKLDHDIIQSLLQAGANINLKNNQGNTPLDVFYDEMARTLNYLSTSCLNSSSALDVTSHQSLIEGFKEEASESNGSKTDGSNIEVFQSVPSGCDDTNITQDSRGANPGANNQHTADKTAEGRESSLTGTASDEIGERPENNFSDVKAGCCFKLKRKLELACLLLKYEQNNIVSNPATKTEGKTD